MLDIFLSLELMSQSEQSGAYSRATGGAPYANALSRVYSSIKENGIADIGLASALDVGVNPSDFVQVPASCLKVAKLDGSKEIPNVMGTGDHAKHAKPIIVYPGRKKFEYGVHEYTQATHVKLTDEELTMLAIANHRSSTAMGWE